MSTYPRLEARVSAQERQQTIMNARMEEVSDDTTASFKQLVEYQIQTEHQMETRFNQVEIRLDNIETVLTQILARLPEKP